MEEEDLRGIKTHACLMSTAFGFLMPLGILTVRLMQLLRKRLGPHHSLSQLLFYLHQFFQISATIILIAGIAYSLKTFGVNTKHTHQRLGLCLWGIIIAQILMSIYRPSIGSTERMRWYLLHWLMGTGSVILGFYNIFVGMKIWEIITHTSIKRLNIAFAVYVAFITSLYFLEDRMENFLVQMYGLPQRQQLHHAPSPSIEKV